MAETILRTAQERVAEKFAARQGIEVKAIDPGLLTLILEAVLMVVERCLNRRRDDEVAESMRSPGLLEDLAVRQSVRAILRETYGWFGFYRHGGAELAQALLDTGREASGEERRALVREIRQRML